MWNLGYGLWTTNILADSCRIFFFWSLTLRKCPNVIWRLAWNSISPFLPFLTWIIHIFGHRESGHGPPCSLDMHEQLCKPSPIRDSDTASGRYKRYRMVQYFNTQFPSLLEYKSSEIFKMFDVNATRLPIFTELIYLSYVGDDVSRTLTRGERWVHHPFNDVPI